MKTKIYLVFVLACAWFNSACVGQALCWGRLDIAVLNFVGIVLGCYAYVIVEMQ